MTPARYADWQEQELARREAAAGSRVTGAFAVDLSVGIVASKRGSGPAGTGSHGTVIHGPGAASAHYMAAGQNHEDYDFYDSARSDHRFHVCVELPTPPTPTTKPINISFAALVDTGADALVLPLSLATAVGWLTSTMTSVSLSTAGGSVPAHQVTGHHFSVDGVPVRENVIFAPSLMHGALCGRRVLLQRFNIGFSDTEWLRTDIVR